MSTINDLTSEAVSVLRQLALVPEGSPPSRLTAGTRVVARRELVPLGLAVEGDGRCFGLPALFAATDEGRALVESEVPPAFRPQRLLAPTPAATDPSPPPASDVERVATMVHEAQERLKLGAELVHHAREALEHASVDAGVMPLKDAIGFTIDALELFLSPMLASESMVATFEPAAKS
jgi:hypothetical protein